MAYYTSVIIISWLGLAALCILVYENDRLSRRDKNLIWVTYLLVALSALAEWLGVRFSGDTDIPGWLLAVIKCADYILTPVCGGTLVGQLRRSSLWQRLIRVLITVNAVFQPIAFLTGKMLIFDDQNHYAHGPLYSVYEALFYVLVGLIAIEFFTYGKDFRRQNRVSLYVTFLLVFCGILLQELSDGSVRVSYLTVVLGMALLYIHNTEFSQLDADDTIRRQRVRIMLGQIQPHFLSNCLAVIRETYRTDTQKGDRAIKELSDYLRHNMDSLQSDQLIPLQEELKHVKHYLHLQELRFEDELNVEYDLECTDLLLPPLTLQPLVENAVTYGVRKQRGRTGRITIRSREYPDRYEIQVIDNGPGFVPDNIPGDSSRSHVGIQNVREHLQDSCGGDLVIESEAGQGTKVTMILPKADD